MHSNEDPTQPKINLFIYLFIYLFICLFIYLLKKKQAHRHREQTCGCQRGGEVGEGRIGSLGLADVNCYIEDG